MYYRVFKITKARIVHANQKQKSTLYELKDLEDPIPWKKADGLILINEKASSYDLLDRKNVELLLKNTISKYSVAHSTVVGLIGEWGAGKTTLLNLVKKDLKKEDFVFANQDFDVWLFGSQEALIKGLYDFILNGRLIQYLKIGVCHIEFNTLNAFGNHAIYCITATAADTEYFNFCHLFKL